MSQIILHGRKAIGGSAAGEAIVSVEPLGGFCAVNAAEGRITERGHELEGQCFAGKILVFSLAKGSSGWSGAYQAARQLGKGPTGLVVKTMNTRAALGAVLMRVPTMTDLDQDPTKVIENGDWVEIDAENGCITVTKQSGRVISGAPE